MNLLNLRLPVLEAVNESSSVVEDGALFGCLVCGSSNSSESLAAEYGCSVKFCGKKSTEFNVID